MALYKQATEANDRGDYDKAIQYWRAAYGFDCTAHRLLINIANAYEKKGDKAVRGRVARGLRLERAPAAPTRRSPRRSRTSRPRSPPRRAAGSSQEPANGARNGPAASPRSAAPGERPYGAKPWVLVVTGGVFVVVGAILLPVGCWPRRPSADTACPTHMGCTPDVASQGNTGRLEVGLGWTALVVGAAAAGGGLVWQFALNKPSPGPKQGSTEAPLASVRVAPFLAPRQSGLAISGSF